MCFGGLAGAVKNVGLGRVIPGEICFAGSNMGHGKGEECLRIGEALASCAEKVAHFGCHSSNPSHRISCMSAVRSL